jgi:hypothetical protein
MESFNNNNNNNNNYVELIRIEFRNIIKNHITQDKLK